MSILMCKDTPVYDIDNNIVLSSSLLPGLMHHSTFKDWFKLRYSANTNTVARKLQGVTFKQSNRVCVDSTTHAFSLSDCYWVRQQDEDMLFEEYSPYYAPLLGR